MLLRVEAQTRRVGGGGAEQLDLVACTLWKRLHHINTTSRASVKYCA